LSCHAYYGGIDWLKDRNHFGWRFAGDRLRCPNPFIHDERAIRALHRPTKEFQEAAHETECSL
jgi:hypothetical protein